LPQFSLSVLLAASVLPPLSILFHEQQTFNQIERNTKNGEERETKEEPKHSNLLFRLSLHLVLDPSVYGNFLRLNVSSFKKSTLPSSFIRPIKTNLLKLSNKNVSMYDNIEFVTYFN
jgi:hypothetical protein